MRGPVWRAARPKLSLLGLLAALAVSGCLLPAPDSAPPPATAAPTPALDAPASPLAGAPPSGGPALLAEQPAGGGTLRLLRYTGAGQTCVAVTFNMQTLEANRCGAFAGAGVGFVDTLTDPGGQPVRVAYGLLLEPSITAVAVEFAGGGNANVPAHNGGYLLVLEAGQTPQRAIGINQFGNLVGSWAFR